MGSTADQSTLAPTLWRTFRVLANKTRQDILETLCAGPPLHVEAVAAACRISEAKASDHLRALQSRGLLAVERWGRFVFYRLQADPSVQYADAVVRMCRASVRRRDPIAERIFALTAFTHARRIALARALARQPAEAGELASRCGISRQALYRHLDKLQRRGVVEFSDRDHVALVKPKAPLLRDLMELVCAE